MRVALRKLSIGDDAIERGQAITAEQQAQLPPRRVETLKSTRWVEEITDEHALERAVNALARRITRMEEVIDQVVAVEVVETPEPVEAKAPGTPPARKQRKAKVA